MSLHKELPSNRLGQFNATLTQLIPSLYDHYCSPGVPGGFFERLKEGTWLGHVIEHVALELQTLAGMDCGFGRTYGTSQVGVYLVIFTYELEEAGFYAGQAAYNLVDCLASGKEYKNLEETIQTLKKMARKAQLGPSTESLVREAKQRKIPVYIIPDSSLMVFGQGCYQKKMWATVSSETSSIAAEMVGDKELTKNILNANFIPVPYGMTIRNLEELDNCLQSLSYPLVIKPFNGNHGKGVLTDINTREKALLGYELAKKVSNKILVEEYVTGEDYRFLVIDYKVVAVAKRTPAFIIGNGIDTIQELITKVNEDPQRGPGHDNILTAIEINEETNTLLIEQNLSLDSTLAKNQVLYLKSTANLSSGGTATDVTDLVHPLNIQLAERVARLMNLDICGIDIIAKTIHQPIQKNNGAVIEVNAGPGLRMHLQPSQGRSRNVAAPIIEMLYPRGAKSIIPIIAVTGTNGKTTIVRLTAFMAQKANYKVGFSTTEGIYSNGQLVYAGDCSGPKSTRAVISDPSIDFAVLECARGGILRSGLAFDECDISIITNITSDHLGLKGINSLEDLAQVKSVVAKSTKKTGYCILNAEDELVYDMKKELVCSIALFALSNVPRIQEHCKSGGFACYIEEGYIVVQRGRHKDHIAELTRIPLSFKGTATSMIKNILPSVLAGVISKFALNDIESALYEFLPAPENLPGRMNLFDFGTFQLMVDYAHNEGAYIELKNYVSTLKNKRRIGIVSAAGDRRPIDIQKIGYYAAEIFNEIIITHDKNKRGNSNENITKELIHGIRRSNSDPHVEIISDEYTAIHHVLASATEDSFIFYTPENILDALEFIKTQQEKRVRYDS